MYSPSKLTSGTIEDSMFFHSTLFSCRNSFLLLSSSLQLITNKPITKELNNQIVDVFGLADSENVSFITSLSVPEVKGCVASGCYEVT